MSAIYDEAIGESAGLLGEYWMVRDAEGTVSRMVWAGGRELYDACVAQAQERFGMTPIEIPYTAIFGVADPTTGEDTGGMDA